MTIRAQRTGETAAGSAPNGGSALRFVFGRRGRAADTALDVRRLADRAAGLGRSLLLVSKGFEGPFLTLGETLESVAVGAAALTDRIRNAAALVGARSENSPLGELGGLVASAQRDLARLRADQSGLRQIDAVVVQLENVRSLCARVEEIASFFGMVGLNMAVESARTERTEEAFAGVADEIKQFRPQAVSVAEKIRGECEAAMRHQRRAREQLARGMKRLGELTGEAEREVETSLGEIHRLLEAALAVLADASKNSREISFDVGEVVAGIQIHDSMHQRIQHITAALEQLAALEPGQGNGNAAAGGARAADDETRHAMHSILLLQAEQLRQIVADVDAVYETQARSFDGFHDRILILAGELQGVGGDARHGTRSGAPGALETLPVAAARLGSLLDESHGIFNRLLDTAAQASEAAGRMGGHLSDIHEIGREVKLRSLNAIVRSVQIGQEGRPLKVLAQNMRGFSTETASFVERAGSLIEAIVASSLAQRERVRDRARGATGGSSLQASLHGAVSLLDELFDRFRAESETAQEHAGALAAKVLDARNAIVFLDDLGAELGRTLGELEGLARELSADGFGTINRAADVLRSRYTTRQENTVHREVVRLGAAPAARRAADPDPTQVDFPAVEADDPALYADAGASSAAHEFGDNVDLF